MTLPYERLRSIQTARDILVDLINKPNGRYSAEGLKSVARSALRHFPTDFDLEQLSDKCPELLSADPKAWDNIPKPI